MWAARCADGGVRGGREQWLLVAFRRHDDRITEHISPAQPVLLSTIDRLSVLVAGRVGESG